MRRTDTRSSVPRTCAIREARAPHSGGQKHASIVSHGSLSRPLPPVMVHVWLRWAVKLGLTGLSFFSLFPLLPPRNTLRSLRFAKVFDSWSFDFAFITVFFFNIVFD